MKEKFEISADSMAKLSEIQSRLAKSESKEMLSSQASACTCCWGGWCANGCTG